MFVRPFCVLAFLAATLHAAEPIPKSDAPLGVTLAPGKAVTVDLGKKCIVEVTTTAKKVTWKLPADVEFVVLDGKRIAVWALPGSYTIHAMVPAGDDVLSTEIALTVTGARPLPPAKDPLLAPFQAAYLTEPILSREGDKASLGVVYKATANGIAGIKTAGDLFAVIRGATEAEIGTRLKNVRAVFNAEFAKIMPTDAAAVLTDKQKADAKALLLRGHAVLQEVK